MNNDIEQFEIKTSEEVELLDDSSLSETVGGASLLSSQLRTISRIGISPINFRSIELVMGKTVLIG